MAAATAPARIFTSAPAVRAATPLWVGLVGPSFSGKTFSAMRLATGMQRVSGGEIAVIDTEARRALHYADTFQYLHVPFEAPFAPADYGAAIAHCVAKGARTVVIDSSSHVWEGPGGILEWHEKECDRLVDAWRSTREKVQMAAWQKPKAALRRWLNDMLQMPVNFIFCLRAKEKLRIVPGKDPEKRGWQPIGAPELTYELTLKCLLLPGSDGVPTWSPAHDDEKLMVKLPVQFRTMFSAGSKVQLSEDLGEQLARWAAGAASVSVPELIDLYSRCSTEEERRRLGDSVRMVWRGASPDQRTALKAAVDAAAVRITAAAAAPAKPPSPTGPCNDDGSVPGM